MFEQIFPGILKYCEPDKSGQGVEVNGHMIPSSLAEVSCVPETIRLFDPSTETFLKGLAKCRALIETYPTVFMGNYQAGIWATREPVIKMMSRTTQR